MEKIKEEPLLVVKDLRKFFPVYRGIFSRHVADVKAVDRLGFTLNQGETLGLVGESGCGKTTVGRCLLRLLEPTSGEILFRGQDVMKFNAEQLKAFRREVQIIFQDPYSSLNPRKTVSDLIGEALVVHRLVDNEVQKNEKVVHLLEKVGLSSEYLNRYPHEFSGGQRQRIGIARAIALNPSLIVCDEAVSALDVSVQAQVLNLLIELKKEMSLSYVFIAHDLSVVKHVSTRIAVMYLGQVVEVCTSKELFAKPAHPYTRALLSAIPRANPRKKSKPILLKGDVPTPIDPPPGCYFSTRCPEALPICKEVNPPLKWLNSTHLCKCHLVDDRRQTRQSSTAKPKQERRQHQVHIL